MQKEIEIPEGAEASIDGKTVVVKGPKGELKKNFNNPRFSKAVTMAQEDRKILVKTHSEKRNALAMAGTIAAHIRNMLTGVTDGYSYELKIVYMHFPITVTAKDGVAEVKNFLGEKGVRRVSIFGNCDVHVEKDIITVRGINVEEVGQTAANIERACKIRRRDRRIFQDGIFLFSRKTQSGREV